jgi:hypothetical protein
MKITRIAVATVFTAIVTLGAGAAYAQTATPPTKPTGATINERKTDQQDRIAQGVKSGQLTAGETSKLEHQEAGINKEESGMRAQDNGKLTGQDKKTLTRQQNAESKRIYRDKHNARKQ